MKRKYLFLLISLAAILFAASSRFILQASAQQPQPTADLSTEHRALIDKYCVTCHSQRTKTAGLTLETTNLANVPAQSDIWEKVIRKLRAEMMPPVGAPHPDEGQLNALDWTRSSSRARSTRYRLEIPPAVAAS